jgi:hypothetical protein
MNRSDIVRTMSIFHQPDDVVEIRIPDAGQYRTISGYFDDQEKLATAIEELTEESYQGYYFTINSIDPALLARANNRYKKYAKTTTADADVSLICWLPIDLDPVRPAGISSTDEEHREALEMAKRIRTNLIERGWPEAAFVLADSGNGGHLVVKIDPLDNNPENVKLIRQCLVAMDYQFSDEKVKVDISTHNPARIWKIYGTPVRKGDKTPDRTHRIARLLEVPDALEVVPKKMLEDLAAVLPSDKATKVSSDGDDFDPEAWAMDHGLSVSKVKDWNDGVLVELETCPFNSEHHQTARIGRLASRARHFGCFHNGCQGKKWQDVRDLLERGQKHSGKKSKNSELIETNDVQPTIFTTDRHFQDITNEAMAALLRINSPPHIFVRSDGLTRQKINEKGAPVLQHLNENMLRGILARSAKYVRTKGRSQPIDYNPPLDVVRDILSFGSWPGIPPIEGIVESPVIRQDGTILDQPGYDAASALFYAPSDSLKTLNVPEKPSRDEAIRAAEFIISEVLYDFPFKDESSRANAIASMVSVIMRPAIDGNIPLALFDKPQAGTGASLLVEVISLIATGRPAHMMSAPKDDEEWRKMITSSLIEGPAIIVIDNVDGILRASSLSRALTAKVWRDRILGRSEMIDLPQRAAWFATGNNIQLKGDLARRSYWIRMDAGVARPWMRTGFKHDDLLGWVKDHRSEILSALLTIVRAWFAAGRPSAKVLLLGGFNDWTQKVGGVLEFAGVTGFLGNRAELYDSMDLGVAQWDSFLSE